ncbi:MAG: S-layer homology domain-containing protein [Clostridium lundense]|nr:S-layer homology domain-containing protein [Clostridium lundense]
MRTSKKWLSLLLIFCMALSLAPAARADSLKNYDAVGNVRWDGATVRWDAVEHAETYSVVLERVETSAIHVVERKRVAKTEVSFENEIRKELNAGGNKLSFRASVVVEENEEYNRSPSYLTETVEGARLLNGYQSAHKLTGTAWLGSAYPGSYLKPRYKGDVYQIYRTNPDTLFYQWQRSSAPNGMFNSIRGENSETYVVQDSDVGKYLRVLVGVGSAYVYSNVTQVEKGASMPAIEPEVTVETDGKTGEKYLLVSNARAYQDYVSVDKLISDPDAIDWASAASPASNGPLRLPCTTGVNYVYTRSRETETRMASSVLYASVFVSPSASPGDITSLKLAITDRKRSGSGTAEYMVGDVLKLEATASGASFMGVRGDCWWLDYSPSAEVLGFVPFYADSACTTPISADNYYTVVYTKLHTAKNDCSLRICRELKSGGELSSELLIDIADENGDYKVSSVTLPKDIVVAAGYTVGDYQVMLEPSGGKLDGLLFECDQPGAPVITCDPEYCMLTVDATKARTGKYEFLARFTDGREADGMTVTVEPRPSIPVEELTVNPACISLAPGQSVAVGIETEPMGVVPAFNYTVSNARVLDFDAEKGVLTVAPDAAADAVETLLIEEKGSGLTASVTVTVVSAAGAAGASPWAAEEVAAAIAAGLVPDELQGGYQQNITRAEFCRLMVRLVSTALEANMKGIMSDKGLLEYGIFSDAGDDEDILTAYAMGIVNGFPDGTFRPNDSITREQAATMLARAAVFMDMTAGTPIAFADADSFSAWAVDGIAFVSGLVDPISGKAVMSGTGENRFSPAAFYTREQAILTAVRLFHCYGA